MAFDYFASLICFSIILALLATLPSMVAASLKLFPWLADCVFGLFVQRHHFAIFATSFLPPRLPRGLGKRSTYHARQCVFVSNFQILKSQI